MRHHRTAMMRILMVLLALSVDVDGVPITTSCREFFLRCFLPAGLLRESRLFGNRGVVPLTGIGVAGVTTNPGTATIVGKTMESRTGGAYSSGGSAADASSIASAGSNANAGSYVTGPGSSANAKGRSQSSSHRILKDSASTAASSSVAYAFGTNKDGERQYAGALTGARAANVLGDKGVGISNNGSFALAMLSGKANGVSAAALGDTAVNLGKEKIGTKIGIASSLMPGKPKLEPTIQIYMSKLN